MLNRIEFLNSSDFQSSLEATVTELKRKTDSQSREKIWLSVGLFTPIIKNNTRPHLFSIPYPFIDISNVSVCVIGKDSLDKKAFLRNLNTNYAKKILTFSKLKQEYRSFESRRKLCSEYDFFIVDKALLRVISSALGKTFYSSKKHPIFISFKYEKEIAQNITNALQSAQILFNNGPCISIQVAISYQNVDQISKNIVRAIAHLDTLFPSGINSIKNIYLKTESFVPLLVFQNIIDFLDK